MLGLFIGAFVLGSTQADYLKQADQVLAEYGAPEAFVSVTREALATFLEVEEHYAQKDYPKARKTLDAFWAKHPPATTAWRDTYRASFQNTRETGVNIGHPPCYYALRMYDECLRWRLGPEANAKPVTAATLTVLLVPKSEGIEPSTPEELEKGTGKLVRHELASKLQGGKPADFDDTLDLFREYMRATTRGKLDVQTRIVKLEGLTVPVGTQGQYATGPRFAGLVGNAFQKIWSAVPKAVRQQTDWWWVVYPSHVPGSHEPFRTTEFITGGMGTGPDGVSPCFISDDRWVVQKPPHLGRGIYTKTELRAYLPQWLQHEFMHHLYRTWPSFELEAKGHQWFDRTTWPADFVGYLEPDYYAESLNKRLQPKADPPMHIGLLYAPPSPELFSKIRLADVVGKYERRPVENDWHVGEIQREGTGLVWSNRAGKTWRLEPSLPTGLLKTGRDCPYWTEGDPEGPPFHLVLKRGNDGKFKSELVGFSFNGGLYSKTGD